MEEVVGVLLSNVGDNYYDDNMYFDLFGGFFEKSRMKSNYQ